MYDLVLLDVKMPQINGFELYEKIREIDSKVKACFITAYEVYYQSLKEIFPDMDVDCYVKPISIDCQKHQADAIWHCYKCNRILCSIDVSFH